MKKVMILGASIGQLAMIKKAKELGYEVAVVDYNQNAIGRSLADIFFHASTNDIEGVVKVAETYRPDGICTIQTDMPVRSIASVCEKLKLVGISKATALKATDKIKMIETFKEKGVETPWYYTVSSKDDFDIIAEKVSYPCIIKPSDNSGSRGVSLVSTTDQAKQAIEYARLNSQAEKVIVEEYMQGPEVSVEIIIIDKIPYVIAITDKLTTGAPHFVELGHSQPSRLSDYAIEKIKQLAIKAMEALGIENGPGHVEIILTADGPKVVELGARLGGDFITSDLVPLSTGVDLVGAVLKNSCNDVVDLNQKFEKGSAIRFITANEGVISGIAGIQDAYNIDGIVKVELLKKKDDVITKICSSLDRVGYVVAQADTAEKAVKLCELAQSKILIRVKGTTDV